MITVARFSITPVKGLALHHPREIRLDESGVAANRRFFLVRDDGRLFSGVHHGEIVQVRAEWDEAADRLSLTFPGGDVVSGTVALSGETVSTDFWGNRVVESRVVAGPWSSALSRFTGTPLRLVKASMPGGGVDNEPVTISSEASATEVARRGGKPEADSRRFRMLVELAGCAPHEEDSWNGRRVRIGSAVLDVLGPVERCVTTTRNPLTGIHDFDTLRTIAAYRGLRDGKKIDFGVYARVVEPGLVRIGDTVEHVNGATM